MSDSLRPHGLYSPWNSPGQNTGVGSLSLLQGIFPTQGSNPGLLHCRRILYQLSHKGSPRILEWVAYPFLQWIFPTQESNRGLLNYRWILYRLSSQGSPKYTCVYSNYTYIYTHLPAYAVCPPRLIAMISLGCKSSFKVIFPEMLQVTEYLGGPLVTVNPLLQLCLLSRITGSLEFL